MKLSGFRPEQLAVEGDKVSIYIEVDDLLPDLVDLVVEYEKADGRRGQKLLTQTVSCAQTMLRSLAAAAALHAFRLEWTVNLKGEADARDQFVKIGFIAIRRFGVAADTVIRASVPAAIGVVGIDITTHPALTRIMRHEFATPDGSAFDPSPLRGYLDKLTGQQKQLLIGSALGSREGRLVVFVTLYPRAKRRMYADWTLTSEGVVPNATFSVFYCRDDSTMKAPQRSTSPVTLICHTQYLCVNLRNGPTQAWLNPPAGRRDAPGVYDGQRPNKWLSKDSQAPYRFVIAALQPTSSVSNRGIWHAIYEARTGHNIMPGNSIHGMINTKGCWMLFRNFNWPERVRDELDEIYRKVERQKGGRKAVTAKLKEVGYAEPGDRHYASSYDKFMTYDRNWAYLWFTHEIVGIKYYSDTDFWEKKNTVHDHDVAGRDEKFDKFPLSETGKSPAYNLPEEGTLAYHEFDHHDPKVKAGPNLFRENALGFKTASDFSKDMASPLSAAQLTNCSWADVYFYKEDGLDAEKLTRKDVEES